MIMKNEEGLSLVEVLAALLILGIVFVGFMTIFPQMNLFNQRTESKLITMNLAKQELANLKETPSRLTPDRRQKNSTGSDPYETYEFQQSRYTVQIDCYDTPEGNNRYTCSGKHTEPLLHKIHIRVKEQGKLTSETFGYLEIK